MSLSTLTSVANVYQTAHKRARDDDDEDYIDDDLDQGDDNDADDYEGDEDDDEDDDGDEEDENEDEDEDNEKKKKKKKKKTERKMCTLCKEEPGRVLYDKKTGPRITNLCLKCHAKREKEVRGFIIGVFGLY